MRNHLFAAPVLSVLAAAMIAVSPASAAAFEDKALKTSLTLDDFKAIVASLPGHSVEEVNIFSEEGDPGDGGSDVSLRAVDEEGLRYLLIGATCEAAICKGVQLQVRYDNKKINYQQLNEANMYSASASVWFDKDAATLGVSNYVSTEGGVTMANLRGNLVSLLGEAGGLASMAMAKD